MKMIFRIFELLVFFALAGWYSLVLCSPAILICVPITTLVLSFDPETTIHWGSFWIVTGLSIFLSFHFYYFVHVELPEREAGERIKRELHQEEIKVREAGRRIGLLSELVRKHEGMGRRWSG